MSKNDDLVRRLRPCPFCGGSASRQDIEASTMDADPDDPNFGGSFIECEACGASSAVHFDRKENLLDSWDRRHPDAIERGAGQVTDFREMFGDHAVYAHLAAHLLRIAKTFKEGALRVGIEMAATEIAAIADETADDGGDQLQTIIEQMIGLLDGSYALVETDPAPTPPAPAPDAGEEHPLSVARAVGDEIHNLSCERQNDEDLAERLRGFSTRLWQAAPQPPAVEAEAAVTDEDVRLAAIAIDKAMGSLEAALKAKTDEIERLRTESANLSDMLEGCRETAKCAIVSTAKAETKVHDLNEMVLRYLSRAEAAEASNKALREGLEWALAYIDGTTMADLRDSARALLSERKD